MSEDKYRWVFERQLREFDNQICVFRQLYESSSPEERAGIREWLERVKVLANEVEWNMNLCVKTEYDEVDDEGNVIDYAGCDFSPSTLLMAIKAWDAGETFAPDGTFP